MKNIVIIVIIFFTTNLIAQDFQLRKTPYVECELLFKDESMTKGFMKLRNSAFDIRFKTQIDGKSKKIDYKKIEKIIINPNSNNSRTFQYLNNYDTKFKIFVELIYSDIISIYIGSPNRLDLFYSEYDRTTLRERMNQVKFEYYSKRKLNLVDTIELPNGKMINLPIRYNYLFETEYAYADGNLTSLDYYLLKNDSPKLIPIRTYKKFIKRYIQYFDECPEFIQEFKQEKIDLSNLPELIEYYKLLCQNNDGNK